VILLARVNFGWHFDKFDDLGWHFDKIPFIYRNCFNKFFSSQTTNIAKLILIRGDVIGHIVDGSQ
jgi:hypothetical protein